VVNPTDFEKLSKLPEPEKAELDLAVKIVKDLSGEFDITEFKDTYMERVQEMVNQKIKGEKITVKKAPEVEAKSLMTALRDTLKQLEQK
jgi:DNA end-binding protein Ku